MILLTGEEQLEALRKLNDKYRDDDERPTRAMEDEALCEAQLKKVVEWGIERCQEHYRGGGVFSRRECPKCWKDLLDEVKDE